MDPARIASAGRSLIKAAAIFVVFVCPPRVFAQTSLANASPVERAKQLTAQGKWQQVVDLVRGVSPQSADLDFYYGTALARLGNLDKARSAFLAGRRLFPKDPRFPVELAGVAFQQKHYAEAAADLRQSLKLAPHDAYAQSFLGTVFFLQGNLHAALKYWNRVDKPQILQVIQKPVPDLDPQLLDSAFAFAPASTLRLPDLLTSEARTAALGVFSSYQFDLQPRPDSKFDVVFRSKIRQGWREKKWLALALFLWGLPAQTVYPEFFNLRHKAINFTSLYRFDAQKRRVTADLSSPFDHANRHLDLGLDLRSETWLIRDSFTGPAPLRGGLDLRREALKADVLSIVSGRWNWSAGAEISHRDFRNVFPGVALTPDLLTNGYELKQITAVDTDIWNSPERRLTLRGGASSEVGRIWSAPSHSFLNLQAWQRLHWFPRPTGDDYEMQQEIRVGKTWGDLPFDELFTLGLGGDTDLLMRAHIATHDGRKGSAPLGRNYFLSNWEDDKNIYHYGPVTFKLGSFVDTGKITDPDPGLGSHKWLWDIGAQGKAKAFGAEVVLSFGKDLRSGNNAIYVTLHSAH
jgi:tetratricopeptide (TPR) repeat protein